MATNTGKLNQTWKADKNQGIQNIESVHFKTIMLISMFYAFYEFTFIRTMDMKILQNT